jgi:6,7-dimethyl-8-ribityllumazine synthase
MSQSYTFQTPANDVTTQRFAFVHASWHEEIVHQARDSFIAEMAKAGVPTSNIDVYSVPGAFELPLHVKTLAQSDKYAGIVASGFVIDGGIYRHDFVATAVIDGLMRVQLDTEVPVFSVVLTPHHFHEHAAHQQFYFDHFVLKGAEAAHACLQTVASLAQINQQANIVSPAKAA